MVGLLSVKDVTCCFTGHRDMGEVEIKDLHKILSEKIAKLIKSGYRCFLSGGALGFDIEAASVVLHMKSLYPSIKLIMVLPCKNQAKSWQEKDVDRYNKIISQADERIYTSETMSRGCYHIRNKYLVDHSSCCIAYQTKQSGGTAYTVKYAENKGLTINML